MIALLAPDHEVGQAHGLKGFGRELAILTFDLLQTEDIGSLFGDKARDLVEPQADRIDVPSGDTKAHGKGPRAGGSSPIGLFAAQKKARSGSNRHRAKK